MHVALDGSKYADRVVPPHLTVDVFIGVLHDPCHGHLPRKNLLSWIVLGAHDVESPQMTFRGFIRQTHRMLGIQQALDPAGQIPLECVHGCAALGSIPTKSRQHSRIRYSSALR